MGSPAVTPTLPPQPPAPGHPAAIHPVYGGHPAPGAVPAQGHPAAAAGPHPPFQLPDPYGRGWGASRAPGVDPYALPARRRPQRTAAGSATAALGGLAVIAVLFILGVTALGGMSGSGSVRISTGGGTGTGTSQKVRKVDRTVAAASSLYRTGELTPLDCSLPAITPGSNSSMSRFMNRLAGCLDASWDRQFGKTSDLRFTKPSRAFWITPGRSPCGSYPQPGTSAFYCPANETIYVGLKNIIETAGDAPVAYYAIYARVIAHEYGHHVQNNAGILLYGHRQMNDTASIEASNQVSRRIELQAQCLAGAFLGAERSTLPMTDQQYAAMVADVRGRGDDRLPVEKRDHGSSRNYAGWVVKGYRAQAPAVCNTWTAPAAAVE